MLVGRYESCPWHQNFEGWGRRIKIHFTYAEFKVAWETRDLISNKQESKQLLGTMEPTFNSITHWRQSRWAEARRGYIVSSRPARATKWNLVSKTEQGGWKGGSVAEREPLSSGSVLPHPHGNPQPSVIPVLGDWMAFSGLCGHQTLTWYMHRHADKIHTHKIHLKSQSKIKTQWLERRSTDCSFKGSG